MISRPFKYQSNKAKEVNKGVGIRDCLLIALYPNIKKTVHKGRYPLAPGVGFLFPRCSLRFDSFGAGVRKT